jgi:hypothetical protein
VCDCGFVAESADESTFVRIARTHAGEVHGMELSAEAVLRMVEGARDRADRQRHGTRGAEMAGG